MTTFSPRLHRIWLLCLLIIATFSGAAAAATGPIIYVDADAAPGGDGGSWATAYVSLHDALADAETCVTCNQIWVADGIYYTNDGTANTFRVVPGVSMYGGFEGCEGSLEERASLGRTFDTRLSGDNNRNGFADFPDAQYVLTADRGMGANTIIDDFIIENAGINAASLFNGALSSAVGYFTNGASPTVTRVTFQGLRGNNGAGVMAEAGASPTFVKCRMMNIGSALGSAAGLWVAGAGTDVRVSNSEIGGNKGNFRGGVFVNQSATLQLEFTTVAYNAPVALESKNGAAVTINSCVIGWSNRYLEANGGTITMSNSVYVRLPNTPDYTFNNNIVEIMVFGETRTLSDLPFADVDLRIARTTGAVDRGDPSLGVTTDIAGNVRRNGMPDAGAHEVLPANLLDPTRLYVDLNQTGPADGLDWQHAYPDLQFALLEARVTPGITEIWVAGGTYLTDASPFYCNGDRGSIFQISGDTMLALYGGFAGTETMLSQRVPGANPTILDGNIGDPNSKTDNSFGVLAVIDSSEQIVVDGFTIQNAYAGAGDGDFAGIVVSESKVDFVDVIVRNNETAGGTGGGVIVQDIVTTNAYTPSVVTFDRSEIRGNRALNGGGGFIVVNDQLTFTNSLISGNVAFDGGAGLAFGGATLKIINSTLSGNASNAGGLRIASGSSLEFLNSIYWNNNGPETLEAGSTSTFSHSITTQPGTGNFNVDPIFVSGIPASLTPNAGGDFRIIAESPAVDAGTNGTPGFTIDQDLADNPRPWNGGTLDIGAYEFQGPPNDPCASPTNIIYVDADQTTQVRTGKSWNNAYTDLTTALVLANLCPNYTQIWVAAGTYVPNQGSIPSATTFSMANNIDLLGGFVGNETSADQRDPVANVTILDGTLGNSGNLNADRSQYVLSVDAGAGNTPLISGFTVQNAYRDNDQAAGIVVNNDAVIDRVIFQNNTSGAAGGGVLFDGGTKTVTECTFTGNSGVNGGGMSMLNGANVTMTGSEFSNNSASSIGGGILVDGGTLTIGDCTFNGNTSPRGAGMYVQVATVTIDSSTFDGNTASGNGGGIENIGGTLTVTSTSFNANSAVSGGGINLGAGATLTLADSRFTNNVATGFGGAMLMQGGVVTGINRCVFSGNQAANGGAVSFITPSGNPAGNMDVPLDNSLFSGNRASGVGGAIFTSDVVLRLNNSTIAGNASSSQPGAVFSQAPSGPAFILMQNSIVSGNSNDFSLAANVFISFENSIIQNAILASTGTAVTTADPQFVNSPAFAGAPFTSGDYQLTATSPAIDAGNNAGVSGGQDLGGGIRISNSVIDIGAYEFGALPFGTPQAICRDVTVDINATGMLTIAGQAFTAADLDGGSSDNGSINPNGYSIDRVPDCGDVTSPLSPISVTLTVRDNEGNTASCTSQVTVRDAVAPSVDCDNIVVQLPGGGGNVVFLNTGPEYDAIAGDFFDNCSTTYGVSGATTSSVGCSDVGTLTGQTVTFQDQNGQQTTCSSLKIQVVDPTKSCGNAPVANCQPFSTALDPSGTFVLDANTLDDGSSDDGSVLTLAFSDATSVVGNTTSNGLALGNNFGQSFTADQTGAIRAIQTRFAEPADNMTLHIYAGGSGSGTFNTVGSPIYSQTGVDVFTSINGALSEVKLTTPVPVVSGQQYTFIFEGTSLPYLNINEAFGATDAYTGGQAFSSFGVARQEDLVFAVSLIGPTTQTYTMDGIYPTDVWAIDDEGNVSAACNTTVTISQVLPVEWLTFQATGRQKDVLLEWTTGLEEENAGFHVERSVSGSDWTVLGTVPPATSDSHYSFVDQAPLAGTNFYRIRQTDFDGTVSYTWVESAHFEATQLIVYPNPATEFIRIEAPEALTHLELTDVSGRVLPLGYEPDGKGFRARVGHLPPGMYLLRAAGEVNGPVVESMVRKVLIR